MLKTFLSNLLLVVFATSLHYSQSKNIDEFFTMVDANKTEGEVISYLKETKKWVVNIQAETKEGKKLKFNSVTILGIKADSLILLCNNQKQLGGYSIFFSYNTPEEKNVITKKVTECLDELTRNRHQLKDTILSWGQVMNAKENAYAIFQFNPSHKSNVARIDYYKLSNN